MPSGRQWQGSQSSQGASELSFPSATCGRCKVRRRAERVSRPAREKKRRGSWWSPPPRPDRCARSSGPGYGPHLDGQPGAVGGEAARGEMIEADAVLEVSDGILDLGVAAMVGLQFQGFPVPVGDEAVIAVAGEDSWEPGVGFTRRTMSRTGAASGSLEGSVHVGAAGPSSTGVQSSSDRLNQLPETGVLADGDGEADIHLRPMGIEAAVGPHRELSCSPQRTRPTVSRRKWAAPRTVLARPSRSRDISTSPVPAAMASSG